MAQPVMVTLERVSRESPVAGERQNKPAHTTNTHARTNIYTRTNLHMRALPLLMSARLYGACYGCQHTAALMAVAGGSVKHAERLRFARHGSQLLRVASVGPHVRQKWSHASSVIAEKEFCW